MKFFRFNAARVADWDSVWYVVCERTTGQVCGSTRLINVASLAMFAAWAQSAPDWSFATLAGASASLDASAVTTILLLSLFGFGFKAGCVPLHFWLPPAHAAAPTRRAHRTATIRLRLCTRLGSTTDTSRAARPKDDYPGNPRPTLGRSGGAPGSTAAVSGRDGPFVRPGPAQSR